MYGIVGLMFLWWGVTKNNEILLIVSGLFAIAHSICYHKPK